GVGMAIAMIDIDHFQSINERFGRTAGDAVLREVAELLRGAVQPDDLTTRLDADTYAVAIPAADFADAHRWAETLRESISRRLIDADGRLCWITLSVGLGFAPAETPSVAQAVASADLCLAKAKIAGRNCVVSQVGELAWIE